MTTVGYEPSYFVSFMQIITMLQINIVYAFFFLLFFNIVGMGTAMRLQRIKKSLFF